MTAVTASTTAARQRRDDTLFPLMIEVSNTCLVGEPHQGLFMTCAANRPTPLIRPAPRLLVNGNSSRVTLIALADAVK